MARLFSKSDFKKVSVVEYFQFLRPFFTLIE